MTVQGIERIREYLGEYKGNYVIIGGTATNINLEDAALEGRVTHDIDMIMVCEAITPDYLARFWEMIRAAGYEPAVIKTDTGVKRTFYRFVNPKDTTFPRYIELFCRVPDSIDVPEDMHLVHISSEDEYLSSFSAIMMDDDYYNFAVSHSVEMQGVQVLDKFALIVLKAKAYISNLARRESGNRVQSDDIIKHKKDVYRLSFLLDETADRINLTDTLKTDMRSFIETVRTHELNTKALSNNMGVAEISQADFLSKLATIFQL